jgi:hypothetical protein
MFAPGDSDSDDVDVELLMNQILLGGDDLMDAMLGGEPNPTTLSSSSNNETTTEDDEDEEDCSGIEDYRKRMQQNNGGDTTTTTCTNGATQGYRHKDHKSDDDKSSDDDDEGGFSEARDAYMNSLIYGPDAPTRKDVGSFLNKREIKEWRQDIGEIFPQVYEKEYKMFGNDGGGPYGFGTKVRTTEDCEISVYATILGSRFYDEGTYRNREYKLIYYIVKIRGDSSQELMKIEMCDAHDSYRKGWDDGDDDAIDDDVKDMLPRQVKDDDPIDEKWTRLEERHLQIMGDLDKWNDDDNGPVEQAFWNTMFTPDEVKQFKCGDLLVVPSEYKAPSSSFGLSNLEERLLLMSIVLVFVKESGGAVILENQRGTKYHAIDLYDAKAYNGTSVIDLQFAISYDKESAEAFLRGETIKTMVCSGQVMNAIETHMLETCLGRGLNDLGSGLLLFEGFVAPIRPMTPAVFALINAPGPETFRTLPNGTFGIEFELSCTVGTWSNNTAYRLQTLAHVSVRNLYDRQLRDPMYLLGVADTERYTDEWRIERDESIRKSPDYPNSIRFEFISPILEGETGLDECHRVLDVLNDVTAQLLNKSMGMHLHVGIEDPSLGDLKNFCFNVIKYEDAIDTFMAPTRRENRYCKSNKKALLQSAQITTNNGSYQEIFNKIEACRTKVELFDLMNPNGRRYYKVNLQNLKTGKRPTVEFRQHAATSDYRKAVEPWVRFCKAFVHNSLHCGGPLLKKSLESIMGVDEELEELFDRVIQDPALKRYYTIRREDLRTTTTT